MPPIPPPSPFHIGRSHSTQVNALHFSRDNERLYSGDGGGLIACTLTRTFRAIAVWAAHNDTILTINELDGNIITHARDNKLHVWSPISRLATITETAASSSQSIPSLLYSMDVNALNFCRFSLLPLPPPLRRESMDALIAVPNLVNSALCDVWSLPGRERIHAAIGKSQSSSTPVINDGRDASGIVMAHHLYQSSVPGLTDLQLRLLAAFEDGHVALFARMGWDTLWSIKVHVESVMGMSVSNDATFALTVSADHLIGKILLTDTLAEGVDRIAVHRTKHVGNSAVMLRSDARMCAVAGWDGKVRLYSTKSFKTLGTLKYHGQSVYAVTFARGMHTLRQPSQPSLGSSDAADGPLTGTDNEEDDGWEQEDSEKRCRWLVSAGKEGRVAFWLLDTFEKG
ncbi:hypothetical protein BS47DRAFT_1376400 [Hydnum rufescens UP504]|uniref:ASTRA-associated protein 1 n=1 Tax=Hydnum rufescens UP504 TaxID=1448309 RepID=A0A9P6B245_9AGAM|nr:hypothetical protein BS47DRAFT_1376400 [Hydnum rufescens UP504]